MTQQYQLFDALTPTEYGALKADIRERGVLVPIEVDETGAILDGHHRVRAWQELRDEGVDVPDYPRMIRAGMDEAQKRNHVRALNVIRRHLTGEARAKVMAEMRAEGMTLQAVADAVGVSHMTVKRAMGESELTNVKSEVVNTRGQSRPATYAPRKSTRYAAAIFATDQREQMMALKKARNGDAQHKAQQERMAPKFDRLREIEEQGIYIGSIWSFGPRANYAGSADYAGNSIPQIVENAVLLYTQPDGLVVDPMAGSGTTVEVCRVLGRRCLAFDIQPANATGGVIQADAADLRGVVDDGAADMVFWHPPYWRLKVYSHEPGDISAMPWPEFLQACGRVIREMARILKPGGTLVILSGDMVKDARYYPVARKLANAAEDAGLVDCGTAIKTTVNSTSQIVKGKTIWAELAYSGNLKIEHDTINIFRKPE